MKKVQVELSINVVIWTIGILFLLTLAYLLRGVLILFFFTLIFYSGLRPIVDKLEKYKLPRLLSVLLIYLVIIIFILLLGTLTLGTFINQFNNFISDLPEIVRTILNTVNSNLPSQVKVIDRASIDQIVTRISSVENFNFQTINDIWRFISDNLGSIGNTGFSIINTVSSTLFSVFIIVISTAYLLVRKEKVSESFTAYFSKETSKKVRHLIERVEVTLGDWLVGELVLMFIIGFMSYIALVAPHIFGIEGYTLHQFALLIALVAGINEAFPNIGPAITLVLTTILAFATAQPIVLIIYIIIAFLAIQQIEGLFITPIVMKRVVHVDPIITIFGIVAGLQIGGVIGAIISLPLILVFKVVIQELTNKSQQNVNNYDSIDFDQKVKNLFTKFF